MRVDGATYRKRADAAAALDTWAHRYGRLRIGPVVEVAIQINVSTDGETLSWAANYQVQTRDLEQRIRQAKAGQDKPFRYTNELEAAEARYTA